MKLKLIALIICGTLALIHTSMAEPTTHSPKAKGLTVEIMIFSGRPNPIFTITDPKEIAEIASLVGALPARAGVNVQSQASAPKLGFQGIAIRDGSQNLPNIDSLVVKHARIRVARPTSLAKSVGAAAVSAAASDELVDMPQKLEKRLLDLGKARGVLDDGLISDILAAE